MLWFSFVGCDADGYANGESLAASCNSERVRDWVRAHGEKSVNCGGNSSSPPGRSAPTRRRRGR